MKNTPIGLAEIARAFRALEPDSKQQCRAIAQLLGLDADIAFDTPEVRDAVPLSEAVSPAIVPPLVVPAPLQQPPLPPPTQPQAPAPPLPPRASRPPSPRGPAGTRLPDADVVGLPIKLTQTVNPANGTMPGYIADAPEVEFTNTERHLPPSPPLIPATQMRSFATELISAPVPGEADIDRLVMALARGRLPRELPRTQRKGTARRVHLIIDTADSMRLLQRDSHMLTAAVRAVAGPALQSEQTLHGPPSARDMPAFARGDTVLVVSDLGIGSGASHHRARIAEWRHFATWLQAQGLSITAVVPFHHTRWPRSLRSRVRIVHWHRLGTASLMATDSDLFRLGVVLSRAAVIDPALLRRARLKLLPATDAGVEADFAMRRWTSAFNPRVISLSPLWLLFLRSELAGNAELRALAEEILQRPETRDWQRVVFEEQIIGASLQMSDDPLRLKVALAQIIRTLLSKLSNADTARWALCLLDELPAEAQETEAARLLKAVAMVVLGAADSEVAQIVKDYDARWVFRNTVPVGVLWTGQFVVAREPPSLSDRVVEVPDTRPRIIICNDPEAGFTKVLRVFTHATYPPWAKAPELPRRIKTIDGAEYEINRNSETWRALVDAFAERRPVEGTVLRYLPRFTAYLVDIGFNALLPEQQALLSGKSPDELIGSAVQVRITKIVHSTREMTVALTDVGDVRFSDEAWQEVRARYYDADMMEGALAAVGKRGWAVDVRDTIVFVSSDELPDEEVAGGEALAGQTLSFGIVDIDDERREVVLTRWLSSYETWRPTLRAFRTNGSVRGTVVRKTKGGYFADIGFEAFLPASQIGSIPPGTDIIGTAFDFKVVSCDWERLNAVVSHSQYLAEQQQKLLQELEEGSLRKGRIKALADYGAFIDLGGVDGLLHITDMSWGRVRSTSALFQVGEEIEVVILKVDAANARVSLGYKQKNPDPWLSIAEKFPPGTRVHGPITSMTDYGAFVLVDSLVEGLVHVSEMSWTKKIRNPSTLMKVGEEVDAVVLEVNAQNRTLTLSTRLLQPNPWMDIAAKYPIGTVVERPIHTMTPFGVFIQLEDDIDGLIHVSELSVDGRLTKPSDRYKIGDVIKAKVIAIDIDAHRIGLSMKDLLPNQWDEYAGQHNIGDVVTGHVAKITDFGIFIRVAEGVEALAHISEIPRGPQKIKLQLMFTVGQEIRGRIIKIDRELKRIALTLTDV